MRLAKLLVVVALAFAFVGTPLLRAEQDESQMREPSAAKKKKKAKKSKKGKAKPAKQKRAKKAAAKRETRAKSHAPTHAPTGGNTDVPDPYSDISNEKKDDLPPPVNTEPKDE